MTVKDGGYPAGQKKSGRDPIPVQRACAPGACGVFRAGIFCRKILYCMKRLLQQTTCVRTNSLTYRGNKTAISGMGVAAVPVDSIHRIVLKEE